MKLLIHSWKQSIPNSVMYVHIVYYTFPNGSYFKQLIVLGKISPRHPSGLGYNVINTRRTSQLPNILLYTVYIKD